MKPDMYHVLMTALWSINIIALVMLLIDDLRKKK